MKSLFNLDNPFMQFLARVGDLILANFLFLICSLPVITIGPALTGLHKVTQKIADDSLNSTVKTFFEGFRENFRQAAVSWAGLLIFLICMVCNYLLIISYFTGNTAKVLKALLFFLVCVVLGISAYLFPLMVRYENTLVNHIRNAGILAVIKLPRTLGMLLLNNLPFLLLYFSIPTFSKTFVFWLVIGFGFTSYISSIWLLPVFREMEAPKGPNMRILD